MGEVRVGAGAAQAFAALAADLRKASARTLRAELAKGLMRAQRPLKERIIASAAQTLPSGGGRGRRRTRLADTGQTLTNAASGKTHKVKRKVAIAGALATGESLADRVVKAKFRTSVSGGSTVRARITATEARGRKVDLRRLNKGEVRHPVFGKWRKGTPTQYVTPGWFDKPIEASAGDFAKALDEAVSNVTEQINRG